MKLDKNPLRTALIIGFISILVSLIIIVPLAKKIILSQYGFTNLFRGSQKVPVLSSHFIEKYNPKTQAIIDVLHYSIHIELLPESKTIKGKVLIKFAINNKNAEKIDINFYDNLKILDVRINDQKIEYERDETIIHFYTKGILKDTSEIKIVYEGEPKNLGFGSFCFEDNQGESFVYTISEPFYASTWFPCVDKPDDKALADIYITNDSSYVSLSNGKLIRVLSNNSKKTYHWKTIYPISTYLITIYSGKYKSYNQKYVSITNDTLDLYYYALANKFEDAIKDFSDHPKYIYTFEKLFGPYPFLKEKYAVAEFLWEYGAMEHQTITGIGSRFITGKRFFQDMLIHELAHHWWGNAVGPKTWKDIWLNEGFATYSEALYWEFQAGKNALQSTLNTKRGKFSYGTLYNPENNLFSNLVYNKGAWVLHMLRREVGDSNFFKILRTYFQTYKYKNASTEDFQNVCEKVSNKNLDFFFDQWVYKGEGIIESEYNWDVNFEGNMYKVVFQLNQLQTGYDVYKFPFDIKIYFENDDQPLTKSFYVKERNSKFEFYTLNKPVKIEVDPEKWLLAEFKTAR
ncbi:MAG: M1 family metallopeptidase [Melioribacter sp.]|nr:M1 family metallopeptidase [Melioribacter sp.]